MRTVGDLMDPARDLEPPLDPAVRPRAYVVCSTPRSGSGLLCRGLAAARVAGTPHEYFNPVHRRLLAERWGCGVDLRDYAAACLRRRSTAAGVFGCKLHWDHLVALRAEALGLRACEPGYDISASVLHELIGEPLYIRIVRRDVDLQAVSLWFAFWTASWSMAPGDRGDEPARAGVPYSAEGIERCRRMIENADVHWDRFLRFNAIRPVEVVYEDLAADFCGEIARVLGSVVPEASGVRVGEPSSRRMGDSRSAEFVARLRSDRERDGLPDPLELVSAD